MYRQCNASMHSEPNQPFLCNGCIASIYFLKILAHSAATVQCMSRYNHLTYRWIRGYQRHKWGFQVPMLPTAVLKMVSGLVSMISHIAHYVQWKKEVARCPVNGDFIYYFVIIIILYRDLPISSLAPQCAHSIGLRPSIHQTSRCWVAVTELCPPSMYSATAPTDSIHL